MTARELVLAEAELLEREISEADRVDWRTLTQAEVDQAFESLVDQAMAQAEEEDRG